VDLFGWAGLAVTTTGAALLYALTGFGFAILAAPLFLLFVDPAQAVQLVIIISTALSVAVLPGLWRAIAPWLLLRLGLGCLAGLPLGLAAFRRADPILVRAVVGTTILAFAVLLAWLRHRVPAAAQGGRSGRFGMRPDRDLAAGAVSGVASALVGMAGPPVVIYLLLAGAPPRIVRATLLSFFALAYAATLVSHAATVGIPTRTWLAAGVLIPFAFLGGLAGRPLGDRLDANAFATLAILLLAAAGLYTLAAAAGLTTR
jgi:uncharacterized protein